MKLTLTETLISFKELDLRNTEQIKLVLGRYLLWCSGLVLCCNRTVGLVSILIANRAVACFIFVLV